RLETDLTDRYVLITNRDPGEASLEESNTPSRSRFIKVFPVDRLAHGKRLIWKDYLIERLRQFKKDQIARGEKPIEFSETNPEWTPQVFGTFDDFQNT